MNSGYLLQAAISFGFVVVAITVHEASHAWAADRLGDPTAMMAGRLSLNPVRHLDPVGTVLVPLILVAAGAPAFGWAKPVPINPNYFRNHRAGMMISALAGPASNFLLAATLGLVYQVIYAGFAVQALLRGPLYGGTVAVPGPVEFLYLGVLINVFLGLFNLIPIPPLDGSRVVPVLVPALARTWDQLEQYGLLLFFLVIFVLPRLGAGFDLLGFVFERVALPVVDFLTSWAVPLLKLAGLVGS